MVSGMSRLIAVKCQRCQHEDVVFHTQLDLFSIISVYRKNFDKCPKCGGIMSKDPSRVIVS